MDKKTIIVGYRSQGYSYNKIVELTGFPKSLVAYYCNTTTKDKNSQYRKTTRDYLRSFIRQYKTQKGCETCGETHYACLELHHTDPEKKSFALSKFFKTTSDLEIIKKELEKCIVLCANCHRKAHWID